jgi:hypothetical protein
MNYYEILGVEKDADANEIRKSYKQLVKKYHPDVNNAANANVFFNLIQEAHRVLSDEKLKRDYDLRNNFIHERNTYKADSDDVNRYDFKEVSEEEINEIIRKQKCNRGIFTRVLIVLLKILLAICIPIISFCEFISTLGAGIISLISKLITIVFIGCTIMGIYELHNNVSGSWSIIIFPLTVAFVAFCIPYVIIMIPVVFGLLKNKITDFILDKN